MTNELTPMQSFEEKIKDKLTKDIGDLIPDDALKVLVEKATQDVFFKDQRIEPKERFSSATYKDSVFKEIVKELLAERMDSAIREFINDNREEMSRQLRDFVETSAQQHVLSALFGSVSNHFEFMQNAIKNDLMNSFTGNTY